MKLPPPGDAGTVTVEQAIARRRTTRSYLPTPLEVAQLSRLLWSAQGVTGTDGFKRAAPSAGALFPMDIYVVAAPKGVRGLYTGVYHYKPTEHAVSQITPKDMRDRLARACLSQMWMTAAPIIFVITAEYNRVTCKYANRGVRYALIEAGHIMQNLMLQAEALGLRAAIVGAFDDRALGFALNLPPAHEPLLVAPIGYAAPKPAASKV